LFAPLAFFDLAWAPDVCDDWGVDEFAGGDGSDVSASAANSACSRLCRMISNAWEVETSVAEMEGGPPPPVTPGMQLAHVGCNDSA
jgi:hypothetical protein